MYSPRGKSGLRSPLPIKRLSSLRGSDFVQPQQNMATHEEVIITPRSTTAAAAATSVRFCLKLDATVFF